MKERNINVWLPLMCPLLGTWPTTQACALNGNPTGNPLVCRPVLNPLSHTSHVFPSLSYLELGSYFFNLNFIFLLQFIFNIIFVLVSGVEHSGWTIIYFTKCSP